MGDRTVRRCQGRTQSYKLKKKIFCLPFDPDLNAAFGLWCVMVQISMEFTISECIIYILSSC